jgi:hypothetical protein
MKRYSLEELKDPTTFQNNPKLATVARRLVDTHHRIVAGNLRMGEFKRRILDGQYPELVKKLWDRHVDELKAQKQALKDSIRFAERTLLSRNRGRRGPGERPLLPRPGQAPQAQGWLLGRRPLGEPQVLRHPPGKSHLPQTYLYQLDQGTAQVRRGEGQTGEEKDPGRDPSLAGLR